MKGSNFIEKLNFSGRKNYSFEKQDIVLQKLARKIDELEEKLGGVGVEKRVAGEKPPKYPLPWPQKAGTSGSYRLWLRFTQQYLRGASVAKWAEFKKENKAKKRKEAADISGGTWLTSQN